MPRTGRVFRHGRQRQDDVNAIIKFWFVVCWLYRNNRSVKKKQGGKK
jgi:hypothetical protein